MTDAALSIGTPDAEPSTHDPHDPAFSAAGWLKMTAYERDALVRPFYADYLTRRAALESAGQYPYNDSFTGHIPGIAGDDESTGIYLLQMLHDREEMRARLAAFLARGARQITADDLPQTGAPLRGTVAVVGEYSGDTGYREHAGVRVVRVRPGLPYLAALPKGKRTNGISLSVESGARVYFLAEEGTR